MANDPIIIGGIGGSGTRVIADILRVFNIFIGSDLNRQFDNLTYTLLFKRPAWYYKNHQNTKKIKRGISIFEKSMTNRKAYSINELLYLILATMEVAIKGHNYKGKGRGEWASKRLRHLLFKRQKNIDKYSGWGWKESNSHLILDDLASHFQGFKYIHTTRHGLDMAYSPNQQQLFNWGALFGIKKPGTADAVPAASFRYWTQVNRKILERGKKYGDDKILILNFDDLCSNPIVEMPKLVSFLGIQVSDVQMAEAIAIPIVPKSRDRYKEHDTSMFTHEDFEFLRFMGCSL